MTVFRHFVMRLKNGPVKQIYDPLWNISSHKSRLEQTRITIIMAMFLLNLLYPT